jgi:diguanylate cyclase (GGDEF)-like protein/PAS domain S-box-containing protein
MKTRLADFSLKTQITWVMFLLFAGSLGLFTLVVEQRLERDMIALLESQQFSTASYIAADIDTKVRQRIDLINQNADLVAKLIHSPEATREFLKGRIGLQAQFKAGIVVVDRNGNGIADYPAVPDRGSGTFSDLEFFQEAVATGKTAIGKPRLGRYSKKPVVSIAAPIRGPDGAIVGVLFGVSPLSDRGLFGNVEQGKAGRSGWILVSSPRHRVILSSSDTARILQPLPPPGASVMLDRFLAGFEGSGLTNSHKGVESLVSAKAVPSAGWIVQVALPTEEAFAPIRNMKRLVFSIAAAMTILVGLVVWLLLRRSLVPLEQATAAIRGIAAGNDDLHALSLSGQGEVRDLLASFNSLVAQRKEVEGDLLAAQRFNQATLDGLTAHICVLDENGVILAVNRAWLEFAQANEGTLLRVGVGIDYLSVCDGFPGEEASEARRFVAGLRDVLARRVDYFEIEYPCHSASERRWFIARVSRLPVAGPVRVVVAHENISSLKVAELKEHAARDYAENLIQSANVMVVELDIQGRLRVLNPVAQRITGYSQEELQGRSWFETLVPRQRYPWVWEVFERLSGGQPVDHFENPIQTKTGEERYIAWSNSVVREDGQVTGIVSFGMDVTEQRNMARRLAEAQRIAHVGTWDLGHADQRMTWSDELYEIVELPPGQAPRAWPDFVALIHPEERARVEQSFAQSLRNRLAFDAECRLLLADGQVRHVALRAETEYAPDGTPRHTFCTVLDVTDKVIQEEMLRESEERYKTIANYTYDWEYWQGTQGEILYMSPSCERITGYSRIDFITDPDLLWRIVHPDDRAVYEDHHDGIQPAHIGQIQFRIQTKAGQPRWIAHGCQGVFAPDGKYLGRRASNRDITDLKDAEEAAHHLAHYDSLTELPNRRMLMDRLRHGLAQAKRFQRSLALMFLDLDRFKQINDSLGHDVGDALLVEVGRRLAGAIRAGDTVARTGGDEFVILLPEIAESVDACLVADKIIQAIKAPVRVRGQVLEVTTSIGIAILPVDGDDDAQKLMKQADIAMYQAKQAGRNCYRLAGDTTST